ncbi:unnamed protein product [Agarophyton chilense]
MGYRWPLSFSVIDEKENADLEEPGISVGESGNAKTVNSAEDIDSSPTPSAKDDGGDPDPGSKGTNRGSLDFILNEEHSLWASHANKCSLFSGQKPPKLDDPSKDVATTSECHKSSGRRTCIGVAPTIFASLGR